MTDNILDAITEHYHSLTNSGKKLADYIFSNTTAAQYLSISALAEKSGVSEATITRFCKSLGLAGYNNFKLALAKADHTTDLGDPTNSQNTFTSEDSLTNILQKIHDASITSLNETLKFTDEVNISKAVEYLASANRVYCLGQGGSMVMAMEAWARFSTAASNFVHISDSHMQVMAVSLATPEDAVLFFSYSGSTKDMEDIMRIARSRNVPVILITHFPGSRAADFADVVLQCGYNENPLQSGSIPAKLGQMLLIEFLFYGFCQKNPKQIADSRAATAEAVAQKLL